MRRVIDVLLHAIVGVLLSALTLVLFGAALVASGGNTSKLVWLFLLVPAVGLWAAVARLRSSG